MKILYESNNSFIARDEKGRMVKIPKNKFADGEIVTTSQKHYSQAELTKLTQPRYTENRGWVYSQNYISLQGFKGGNSFAHDEDNFDKVEDPILKLYAERLILKELISKHENELKIAKENLIKIEYALSVSVGNWDKIEKKCKCGKLFVKNSYNVNFDVCDECYSERQKND